MVGTCTGCGTENVELNEGGMCTMCAGTTEATVAPESTESSTEAAM